MSWIATAVVVGTTVYTSTQSQKASKKQASLQEQQGELARDEALQEAAQIRDESYRFKQEQMMQFVGAGVEITGTPLLLMRETEIQAEAEAKAVEKRGYASSDLANANAKITRSEGRAQLISSLGSAVSSGISTYKGVKGK